MPAQKKEMSMRTRIVVSGLVCLMMASVLLAAAFPAGVHLTTLEQARSSGQAVGKTAETRPRF
jgi:hypothetical protein